MSVTGVTQKANKPVQGASPSYGTVHVQVYGSCRFLACACLSILFRGTSQISHVTRQLKLDCTRETRPCTREFNVSPPAFPVTRSETRATESSLDSIRHAIRLSDYVYTHLIHD